MLIIAHRGASGYEPENTLAAFKKALTLGADMIEFDVRRCKTGEIIVIHDNTVNRTTNGKGKVKHISLQDLKKLDAGKGEKIPTFEELIQLVKKKAMLNINIKEKEAIDPTIEIIQKYIDKGVIDQKQILVSAERMGILKNLHSGEYTKHTVPSLVFFPRLFFSFSTKSHTLAIEVYKGVVSKKLVEFVHKKGMKIYVWTVNEEKDIQKMKALNIDGLITDYPDRV